METSSHKRNGDNCNVRRSLTVICLSYQCLWLMTHRREGHWGHCWKPVTVQVSRSVKSYVLHLILCTTHGTILLWLCLAWLKMWYFSSPAPPPLSYQSDVGREQEGSQTCLSSSADLLCNPWPSPWAFVPQALLESFVMGESHWSKARLSKNPHVEGKTRLLSRTLVPALQ